MESEYLITPTDEPIPLIYNNDMDVTNINNILLIDSTVRENNIFIDSCNINTFPIVYNYYSNRTELKNLLLNKFSLTQLSRIAFVFHNANMDSKKFLNNENFFTYEDIRENIVVSENVQFLIDIINEFNIKHIDYLACNSLQYDNWNKYYNILKTNTDVIVGASDDETGNIKYGGDWLMENTLEDVKNIYFNENIQNYTSTLATTVTINCGLSTNNNIYIKQLTNGNIYYSTTNNADDNITTGTWTRINTAADWQVSLNNTNSVRSETNRLTVTFVTNITLSNISNKFNILTSFITLDGNNKTFYINTNSSGWNGLIGVFAFINDIIIKNFITNTTDQSTVCLFNGCGYIIGSGSFVLASGTNIITNCINYCNINVITTVLNSSAAGLIGYSVFGDSLTGSNNIISNCINYGNIVTPYCSGIIEYKCGYNSNGSTTIENCINYGNILNDYSAGIFGNFAFMKTKGTNNISNCVNMGNISGNYSGGILYMPYYCNISNCYSNGTINNTSTSCGITYFSNNSTALNDGYWSQFIIADLTKKVNINNCYVLYGKIRCDQIDYPVDINITNSYEALGTWNTPTAKSSLLISTNQWVYDPTDTSIPKSKPFLLASLNPTYDIVSLVSTSSNIPCFNKDTKILTNIGYVPIQNLKKGDLVKTLLHDYVPINMIGKRDIYNSNDTDVKNKLYVCQKSKYSEVTEDLIITGSHSILVNDFKEGEREKTIKILKRIFITDNKYRLPACVDNRAIPYNKEGIFTIYHIALDHDNYYMNYGIYANGLLVETCSKRYLKELSQMTLIE